MWIKNGDLAAKGFRQTKDSVADASEIIPKDQWQLLRFDTYDIHMQTVRGGNWKYIPKLRHRGDIKVGTSLEEREDHNKELPGIFEFAQLEINASTNDVKAVQQLLRLVKKEHTTVILPLGGNQLASKGREAELNELKRLSSNICALVDSERIAAGAAADERRAAFVKTCNELEIRVCVTERRAIENYFTDRAIKAAFGDAFSQLEPFQALRDISNGWNKADN